jgi:molybdenum cofactor cytidylyltransferase
MQSFAVIPAAGRSQRMGQPKLLLPWGGSTIFEHVLDAWHASRVDRVVVVVHPLDSRLAELAAACGALVVQPEAPPSEMKISVQIALARLSEFEPRPTDAWLLAPADMPGLTAGTINLVVDSYAQSLARAHDAPRIWVPRCGSRRGHPVLFPWSLAREAASLTANEGLNALLARHEVEYLETSSDAILEDFDTPEDYQRLRARYQP